MAGRLGKRLVPRRGAYARAFAGGVLFADPLFQFTPISELFHLTADTTQVTADTTETTADQTPDG